MNSVQKVKNLCKERKIPISRLEKDLGYANGYIGQLRKGTFPDNRLTEIAKYLNVSVDYLLGKKEISEGGTPNGDIPGYDDLNEANKAIVDSLIDQLLAAQSGQG